MRGRLSSELRTFSELARVVANEPFATEKILARICEELRRSFGFARAMAVRLNAEDATIHAVVQQGIEWPGDQWLLLERFPFLGEARSSGEASFVRDAREEHAMPRKVAELFDVGSIVAVPLCIDDTCFGFLVGDREGATFELTVEELELLTALGRVVAVFLAKADQYESLEQALEELRRLDDAKRDFISIASHELRTPLAVVHGITSTLHLRGSELRDDQLVELRATLFEQTTRVTELVDQLLDLSRLESGVVALKPERFRPRQRLDGLFPRLVPDRLDDIEVVIEPDFELYTDPQAVDRVVSNLVLNALRYGEPPVCVRQKVNGNLELIVEDCGRGVEPDFVPRLFDRFSRSTSAHALNDSGAGLGLSIARSYAKALGGDLTYEPGRPTGARFALVLPLEVLA